VKVQPERPSRPLRVACVALAAAAFAIAMLQLARVDTELGAPTGPDRLIARAESRAQRARADVRDALRWRPIDGAAYRILALQSPERVRRHALLERAVARWPRDRAARAHLMADAFAARKFDVGLAHLDGLLRVAPSTAPGVLRLLTHDLAEPAVRDAVAARVATDPPWRDALVTVLAADTTDPAVAAATLDRMAADAQPKPHEVLAHASALERMGQAQQARALWWKSTVRAPLAPVFDPTFQALGTPGPYAWQAADSAGVDIEPVPRDGLHLDFDGRAVRDLSVHQRLALAPGRYELRAAAANRVATTRPFLWRVQCTDARPPLLDLALPDGEATVTGRFEVPGDCPSQQLRLHHAARSLSEATSAGTLVLRRIGIVPTH
jgi:hypothetical protein